jgi:transitional endoplasmic reticulum ATPase
MTLNLVASEQVAASAAERLTPSQQQAFDAALAAFESNPIVLVESAPGMGKSSVLKALHAKTGGKFLDAETILHAHARFEPQEYEQVVYRVLRDAIENNDIIYYDDVSVYQGAAHGYYYHRPRVFEAVFKALFQEIELAGKRFVVSMPQGHMAAQPGELIRYLPVTITLQALRLPDYQHIFAHAFGEDAVTKIDFEKVYAFSRKLSGYFLVMLCDLLKARGVTAPSTEEVIDVLREQLLKSNVDVREVEEVDLSKMVGVEAIVEKLERTILLPLQDPDLAKELGLEAKHGVLLHGPPGTGKTTIGRALAHKMQGKFFMIDGDFDHHSPMFFPMVQEVFAAAQRNAPAVIFIDDADVILTDPHLAYFGRYLLTQLDGLMNEASGRICVMMTAMDLRGLPLALLRSGRMEVWLEMKLPDAKGRADIIQGYVDRLPLDTPRIDVDLLGEQTEGFTPADLRRLVSDATGHLALDRHLGDPVQTLETYLKRAASALRDQKGVADRAFGQRLGNRYH